MTGVYDKAGNAVDQAKLDALERRLEHAETVLRDIMFTADNANPDDHKYWVAANRYFRWVALAELTHESEILGLYLDPPPKS